MDYIELQRKAEYESNIIFLRNVFIEIQDIYDFEIQHSIYITFLIDHCGVSIPDFLREKYDERLTIVLEHQFDDLEISDDILYLTLYFNDIPEKLSIPLGSIIMIDDKKAEFRTFFDEKYRMDLMKEDEKNEKKLNVCKDKVINLDDILG